MQNRPGRFLQEIHGDGEQNSCQQTGHNQRQAAHRADELAELVGLGGADDVSGSAEGNTLGHLVSDLKPLAEAVGLCVNQANVAEPTATVATNNIAIEDNNALFLKLFCVFIRESSLKLIFLQTHRG